MLILITRLLEVNMFFDEFINSISTILPKKRSKHKNNLSYIMMLDRLVNDALHRYKIEGLPETCDERLIMLNLLWRGNIIFVDYNGSLISLPGTENGNPTIYGRYTSGYTASLNGIFNKWVRLYISGEDTNDIVSKKASVISTDQYNGVCVHESWTKFPFIYYCLYYAEAISDTLRTIDVARKHIKRPYIITSEESVIDTVKKFFKNVDDNDEVVLSSGVFPVDKINILPIETTPDAIKTATELVQWYEARFRELCSLPSNTSIDKKGENLIQGELDVTEDYAKSQSGNVLEVLNEELKIANNHFGTNMKAVSCYDYNDVQRDGRNSGRRSSLSNNDTVSSEKSDI